LGKRASGKSFGAIIRLGGYSFVPKADLPNASQFSPAQVDLAKILGIVKALQPDRHAIAQAIAQEFFAKSPDPNGLADNAIYAMSEYGLVFKPTEDQTHLSLTEGGALLAAMGEAGDAEAMYAEFARHILVDLRGLDLIACVDDLVAQGVEPTKARIIKELSFRGIYHPPNGTHANAMRQWLEMAGVVEERKWVVNKDRLQQVLGVSMDEIEALAGLTKAQRDFVKAFARLNTDEALSNKVAQYATTLYGTEFREGGLPQSVLFALSDVGLITYEKTTGGQGAKPYIVRATDKLRNELVEPILDAIEQSAGIQYRNLVRKPYAQVLQELNDPSKHVKGLALEALAFYLGRLLGLSFVRWRLRSNETGGAELDVIMEGDRLVFSRWQIQCKNAAKAELADIAKEVGIAQVIKANVILIVCTGTIGPVARQFAKQVMEQTNLYVALIDGKDLKQLLTNPADIAKIMNEQASEAMTIKRGQIQLP
jgi:hypothetical protein